jgi:YD repeat-containing protein
MDQREANFMSRKTLKDVRGRTIGFIDDKPKEQTAYDSLGRRTGRYDKHFDRTYDHLGRAIGQGNLVTNTIPRKKP